MSKILYTSLVILAVVAAFEGGRSSLLSASNAPTVITAQAVRIVDSQGSLRAALSVNQSGAAGLAIFEPNNNNPRVIVGLRSDSVGNVELRDSAGTKRGELASAATGEVRLTFWGQDSQNNGAPRLSASVDPASGVASLAMYQPNNPKARLLVGVTSDGLGSVEFRDSDGNKRGEITEAPTGEMRLNLLDKTLRGGVVLGSSGEQTAIVFNDSRPKHRAIFSVSSTGEASAVIYDEDGNIIWQVPPASKK
jgi:hypothetical protein